MTMSLVCSCCCYRAAPVFCSTCHSFCAVLVERLTPQFALFLVTALLMEQPVLLVADPGSDEILMHAGKDFYLGPSC